MTTQPTSPLFTDRTQKTIAAFVLAALSFGQLAGCASASNASLLKDGFGNVMVLDEAKNESVPVPYDVVEGNRATQANALNTGFVNAGGGSAPSTAVTYREATPTNKLHEAVPFHVAQGNSVATTVTQGVKDTMMGLGAAAGGAGLLLSGLGNLASGNAAKETADTNKSTAQQYADAATAKAAAATAGKLGTNITLSAQGGAGGSGVVNPTITQTAGATTDNTTTVSGNNNVDSTGSTGATAGGVSGSTQTNVAGTLTGDVSSGGTLTKAGTGVNLGTQTTVGANGVNNNGTLNAVAAGASQNFGTSTNQGNNNANRPSAAQCAATPLTLGC